MQPRHSILILLATCVLCASPSLAAQKTWTGNGGDGKWESGANWNPPGAPGPDDDVLIPPDSGTIKVDGKGCKKVKSLTAEASEGGVGTKIQADDPGESVCFEAKEDVHIGEGVEVRGNTGNDGQNGGDVKIKAGGTITNDGKLVGGDGGTGAKPGNGGSVVVDGKHVNNNGEENGGAGGSRTSGSGKGKDGGGVTNNAEETVRVGKKSGGAGGEGPAGKGKNGRVGGSAGQTLAMLPGDQMHGDAALLSVHAGQMLLLGLPAESIVADAEIYVDAGGPTAPVHLHGIPAGQDVMVAGESICFRGAPLLDDGVTLADITEPDAIPSIDPCRSCIPNVPWHENFDVWADGYWLDHVGGWKGWDGDPALAASTSAELALSLENSVVAVGPTDLVHEFCGAEEDIWIVRLWQFVPVSFESGGVEPFRGSYIVLLNTYADLGPYHWSAQLHVDSDTQSFIRDGIETVSAPLLVDAWVEVRIVVNFATDTYRVFYGGVEVGGPASWSDGVFGQSGGALELAALDLFANGSSPVYYDELEIVRPAVGDMNCDGAVGFGDINPFVTALTNPALYEVTFPGCSIYNADINRDGLVGFGDINPFVALLSGGGS